jgi:hypothetical protein
MTLERALREVLRDGKLPCAAAFQGAGEQGVSSGEVGDLANKLDVRISHCQLGLFGYGPKAEGKHKILKPAESVGSGLEAALNSRASGGEIACADVWAVAESSGITKMEAAAATEALGMRVTDCQLRCF